MNASATATVSTVSSVKSDFYVNNGKLYSLKVKNSYGAPIMSPAIAPYIVISPIKKN